MYRFLILFSFLYCGIYEKLFEKERSINTFVASFSETISNRKTNTVDTISGIIYYMKPDLFRIDISTPFSITFLHDGTNYYYINHEFKYAYKSDVHTIKRLFGEESLFKLFELRLST
ncbi:MAG: outer-membrane lipoprotein carrier protein LolA, partial [bacterium]|nr:outer-membrane lipoprotein carrier protein LolA [bacterium]